jgi:hypothetical protein
MNDVEFARIVGRQYRAAIRMLRHAIEACPDELWDRRDDEAPPWAHALHVIFYTRLYLLDGLGSPLGEGNATEAMRIVGLPLKDFSESELSRIAQTMGMEGITRRDCRPPRVPTKAELLERVDKTLATLAAAMEQVAAGAADAPNPMPWMTGTRGELLLYNLRHVQHHTGRLHSMLGRRGVHVDWVGSVDA